MLVYSYLKNNTQLIPYGCPTGNIRTWLRRTELVRDLRKGLGSSPRFESPADILIKTAKVFSFIIIIINLNIIFTRQNFHRIKAVFENPSIKTTVAFLCDKNCLLCAKFSLNFRLVSEDTPLLFPFAVSFSSEKSIRIVSAFVAFPLYSDSLQDWLKEVWASF